jgi:hypothetical protein
MPYIPEIPAAPGGVNETEAVVRQAWAEVREAAHQRPDGVVVAGSYVTVVDQTQLERRDG